MKIFNSKHILLALAYFFFVPACLTAQEAPGDSIIEGVSPAYSLRLSGGPAFIATDPGYYIQNELIIDLSKRFGVIASYGTGNAYHGMKDVRRWYLPGSVPKNDDQNRHQSVLCFGVLIQISPLHTENFRLHGGIGPGLNIYNYTEGSLVAYENIDIYRLSNKHTVRMSISYQLGVELKIGEHFLAGLSYYSMRFTENLHSALISTGYRF